MSTTTLADIYQSVTGDTLFFIVSFVLFMVFTLYVDRGRIISFILAFYPATILFNSVPFMDKLLVLHDNMLILNKVAIFLIFLVPISIVIRNHMISDSFYAGLSRLFRAAGFAAIATVLVVMFSYEVVNYNVFHDFSPHIDALFNPATRIFYWNIGIFALLAVL